MWFLKDLIRAQNSTQKRVLFTSLPVGLCQIRLILTPIWPPGTAAIVGMLI
jgi:hypothetical protein